MNKYKVTIEQLKGPVQEGRCESRETLYEQVIFQAEEPTKPNQLHLIERVIRAVNEIEK